MINNAVTYCWSEIISPVALRGVKPSLAGIFNRLLSPPNIIHDPVHGDRKITILSRDEMRRLAAMQFSEIINQIPQGHYYNWDIKDYEGTQESRSSSLP